MKKVIVLLALAIACGQLKLSAQYAYPDNAFREKNSSPFRHRFDIYLGYHNHLQIDLTSMKLLPELLHTDSILRVALQDIAAVTKVDSLRSATDSKRYAFLIDTSGFKAVDVQYSSHGKTFAFDQGELALYKVAQDTVVINKLYKPYNRSSDKNAFEEWRLMLVINEIDDFKEYNTGMLDSTIADIASSYAKESGWNEKNDQRISVDALYKAGQATPGPPFYYPNKIRFTVTLWGEITAQNRNETLLASFVYPGLEMFYTRNFIATKWTLESETFFVFDKALTGKVSIYPNTFINLSYSKKITGNGKPLPKWSGLFRDISLGMLINRKGDYFEKNTFKIRLGGIAYKTLSITPQFFFHDFFKQVQPSLRIGLGF